MQLNSQIGLNIIFPKFYFARPHNLNSAQFEICPRSECILNFGERVRAVGVGAG